jgi:hypothetical protein
MIDSHDFFMIMYLVLTIPWMLLSISAAIQPDTRRRRYVHASQALIIRVQVATLFFATIAPMIYFFIRHSVKRIPGGKLPKQI